MAQPAQSQQATAHLHSLSGHSEQCISGTKLLRQEILKTHQKISHGVIGEGESLEMNKRGIEEKLEFINQLYDTLESNAKSLPNATPITPQFDRISRLINDGQIDLHVNEIYNKLVDSSIWMETNIQMLQMYTDFLRSVIGSRRRSVMCNKSISFSNFALNNSPQFLFEQTLATVLKDNNAKKIGLSTRYIEKSAQSAIIEFKFGNWVEKQYICMLKMLVVINNGMFEFIQIIAPHEEWSYLDSARKEIDILHESRYLVYRKMTVQANIHLVQTIMPCIDFRNAHTLSFVMNMLSKFCGVFETKCRICKRILKDFLPPLVFDLRYPKNALHESCR